MKRFYGRLYSDYKLFKTSKDFLQTFSLDKGSERDL